MAAWSANLARFRMLNPLGYRMGTIALITLRHVSPPGLGLSSWLTLLIQNHRRFQRAMRVFVDEVVVPDALVRSCLDLAGHTVIIICYLRPGNKMASFLAKPSLELWRK